jgi:cytochrome b pre-mRNA-processing protein 3
MIFNPFRKNPDPNAVHAVYNAIVAQSRQPQFYAEWGVPDTVTGRFDMICLHLALLFRRLRSERREVAEFSQAVFDLFFKDMDRSLREMGVGDMAVPKKIQKMGAVFYGLLASLSSALDMNDREEAAAVLARNIFDGEASPSAAQLVDYLFAESERLAEQPVDGIVDGRIATGAAA